ncbi:MAG: RluA family pseudouridine synthase [Eubacteriales bacterium]|jgi:23S rRNA pseudouridine1911/1915/1917 synthase|nr:RluA family pseudouridine synthase [Eubacteriales bacterium]
MRRLDFLSEANVRLDRFIAGKASDISRSQIKKLIEEGHVLVDGNKAKPSLLLKENQNIRVFIPEDEPDVIAAEEIPLDILYEDKDIIVINKPQGMVVHPAAGNLRGTLVNALLSHSSSLSQINGEIRAGIVHRIDKDTSGLLLVAKNDQSHIGLAAQIKEHLVTRRYITIVHGNVKEDSGTINKPIGRHPVDRKKMCVTENNSRHAITHYKVLQRFGRYTYLECTLETGRTHQIRVHMSSMGFPILGDRVYGVKKEKFNLDGQMLHAIALGFTHPITGEKMFFETPVPKRFEQILNFLRNV